MQAIITDIDVSSKLAFDLQNTNNLKNTQNSKSSISFSSMLESVKTENKSLAEDNTAKETTANSKKDVKSEEKAEKKSEATAEKKSEPTEKVDEPTEKVVEKEKTDETDSVKEKAEKKSVDSKTKKSVESVESGNKGKIQQKNSEEKNTVATLVKKSTDSKELPEAEKKEVSKKLLKDFDRMEEMVSKKAEIEVDAEQIANAMPVENLVKLDSSAKTEKSETLEVNTDKLTLNVDEDLSLENSQSYEKVSVLDKDGKIIVKDYRTENTENQDLSKDKKNFNNEVQFDNENTATITMDLASNNAEANVLSLNSQTAASNGSDFQAMLNNQIQTSVPDMVKAGSIILKNNDKGSINLVLHPDDIGNVKINLSMDGKTVSGHIIVQTKEAMAMFKENAQDLRNEFIKNGFDVANFDVSYNDNSGANQDRGFENFHGGNEFAARKVYNGSQGVAAEVNGEYEEINSINSEYSINIVA